jgi:hypothetical protein
MYKVHKPSDSDRTSGSVELPIPQEACLKQSLAIADVFSSLIVFTLKIEAMFLRNVGSYKKYAVIHPRRRYSSYSPP